MAKRQEENTLTPKQTAIWLIDNTALTFDQIAKFCNLHSAEVQAIADGTVASGMVGENPIMNGELTKEEIARCEKDDTAELEVIKNNLPKPAKRSKGPKYTPISKRSDKPDAVMYILKNHPEISEAQIVKIVGTTKTTIKAIRDRSHANISNMKPRHPADLGLCSYTEFDALVEKARAAGEKAGTYKRPAEVVEEPMAEEDTNSSNPFSGFDFSNFMKDGTGK